MKLSIRIIIGLVACGVALLTSAFVASSPALPMIIRVTIAMLIVSIPGISMTAYLYPRQPNNILHYLGYGFAVSLVFIGVIGLLMRTFGWTINEVRIIWQVIVCISILAITLKLEALPALALPKLSGVSWVNLVGLVIVTLFMVYIGIYNTATAGDTGTYNVEVTNFLRTTPMDWQENYYDTGNPLTDRLAFSYWMLAQALIVDLSDLHILQSQFFINSLLMVMMVAAIYIFCRNLGCEHNTAMLIVLLQLVLYVFLLDDTDFSRSKLLNRLFYDKTVASFIIAPIMVSTAYRALQTRHKSLYALSLLLVWSVIFVHPMIMGFVMVTLAAWLGLEFLLNSQARRWAIIAGMVLCVVFSPVILIRFTTDTSDIYDYGEEVIDGINYITVDEASGRYALSQQLVGNLTYVAVVLAFGFALLGRLRTPEHRLILAYGVTVGIALVPYTAWIYGNLVSIQHMNRVVWLTPYGYILSFTLKQLWAWAGRLNLHNMLTAPQTIRAVVVALLWISGLGFMVSRITLLDQVMLPYDYAQKVDEFKHVVEVAPYIEANHDERVMVIGDPDLRDHVLSLTYQAKTLSHFHALRMKAYSRISLEQGQQQIDDNLLFFDETVTPEQQLEIIARYDVRYILYKTERAPIIDALLAYRPEQFEQVLGFDDVALVKVIG